MLGTIKMWLSESVSVQPQQSWSRIENCGVGALSGKFPPRELGDEHKLEVYSISRDTSENLLRKSASNSMTTTECTRKFQLKLILTQCCCASKPVESLLIREEINYFFLESGALHCGLIRAVVAH